MKLRIGRFRFEVHSDKARVGICGGCHWWHVQWETPGERKGHCQRMAPLTDHTGRTLFPRTRDTQYCGQFRERAETVASGTKSVALGATALVRGGAM